MGSEIFRFVTVRPPRAVSTDAPPASIDLSVSKSTLAAQLRAKRPTGGRADMTGIADKFVGSSDFIATADKLPDKLPALMSALAALPDAGFWAAAQQAFADTIGGAPADYAKAAAFTTAFNTIADSILAASISSAVSPRTRNMLGSAIRALWLVRQLAAGAPVSRAAFVNAALVMPTGIFPLPVVDPSLKAQRKAQAQANQAALAARQKQLAGLAGQLSAQRAAAQELLDAFEVAGAAPPANPATKRLTSAAVATPPAASAPAASSAGGFMLPPAAIDGLTAATKGVLSNIGIGSASLDVAKAVTLIEKRAASLATQLYANTAGGERLVRIGQNFLPNGALNGVVLPPAPNAVPVPGPCPPQVDTGLPDDGVTVPTGHGDARVLGIGDLLVLEQELARYQLGEISHIENVLRSEERSRRFVTKDSTVETDVTQTETDETKEQDLSTDQRFQLQTEAQTVISQNDSKSAGLTIHASYGPSVDATANYNATSANSTQQSNQTASTYAQEITNKAVDRVQTKTLTSRTVTTQHSVTEIDRHAFDNKDGTDDIVGVYRYVDKIYSAQIVNYGKRLLLEFIVPEPAAFLRYALTNKPLDTVTLTNPDPPGYCLGDGVTFQALQATDITRDNYLYWASKYGAQDVTSPPPSMVIAQGVKKAPDQMPSLSNNRLVSSDTFDITIPDGYLTQSAFVNIYGSSQNAIEGPPKIVFQIQDQQGLYQSESDDQHIYYLHLLPTTTLSITVNTYEFHNYEMLATIFCTLSTEKFQDWQLKTFISIMNAYNDLKNAYDQAVQQAKLQASDPTATGGTNPADNVITEQIELKKGCISLLTAQRFDLFDAVAPNIAPYGYPEIDFAEAKAEGAYIAAFEQSFEWDNMVYLFYPYFWSNKKEWPTLVQLSDPDPVFRQFLQAGAARVQVPVRPGFEAAILTYLSTGELWGADGTLLNGDDGDDGEAGNPYLSIIDELRSQSGNNDVDGIGTLGVTQGSAEVTGDGTVFTSDDESRRIIIAGVTYVIKTVTGPEAIVLTAPYAGVSATGLGYSTGGVLVGQPWEIKMPTDLVKLDSSLQFS